MPTVTITNATEREAVVYVDGALNRDVQLDPGDTVRVDLPEVDGGQYVEVTNGRDFDSAVVDQADVTIVLNVQVPLTGGRPLAERPRDRRTPRGRGPSQG